MNIMKITISDIGYVVFLNTVLLTKHQKVIALCSGYLQIKEKND